MKLVVLKYLCSIKIDSQITSGVGSTSGVASPHPPSRVLLCPMHGRRSVMIVKSLHPQLGEENHSNATVVTVVKQTLPMPTFIIWGEGRNDNHIH